MSELIEGQDPDALFITCADSRIVPNLITSSGPGDLFTVRNLGNIVPVEGTDVSVTAAVEYAVDVLGVSRIVVCGHSGCGAMRALHVGGSGGQLGTWLEGGGESLRAWRDGHRAALAAAVDGASEPDQSAQTNVAVQVERLGRLPTVRRARTTRDLAIVGMFFDIPSAGCTVLDSDTGAFAAVPLPTSVG